ncbi:conserved hypothetical protein [Candida dubliniensis CD36]|uniref:Uncharacterized protein n=1 Tax=Candida dubliniensis (strain CD36 / ATCC MYA-646 / CBS 7987 / NCPF 3949 / NRRL Y-17841) TaxID=573826 RepID=B9WM31_CANDC|nr:conserved hypothetical protein [Candida dubliniensis CD36]CAX40144.1 conserved hypothetical protein [Candida dubliniensis CD36]
MSGISNLLNSEDLVNAPKKTIAHFSDGDTTKGAITPPHTSSLQSSPQLPSISESESEVSTQSKTSYKPLVRLRDRLPKSKVNKNILASKKFVKLAIRRKYSTKKTKTDTKQSKLHIKSLKAGIKVKMTLSKNLFSLYHCLIPFTDDRTMYTLFKDESSINQMTNLNSSVSEKTLISRGLQLINNNVVDLNDYSNKLIRSFTSKGNNSTPTFNSLDTALNTLFETKNFTLVRITRSTTDDVHGSSILKLETATPGDFNLIDDEENGDEMLHSLGKDGEVPNNLFFKKIIARPRYKSNMKIYFIPEVANYSLYTDERMLERDLYNGIIQLEFENNDLNDLSVKRSKGYSRNVFCSFCYDGVLRDYKKSLLENDIAEVSPSNVQFMKSLTNTHASLQPPTLPAANALFPQAPKLQQSPSNQRAQSIDDTMMVSYNDQHYPPYRSSIPLNRRPSLPMPKPPPAFIQQPQAFDVVATNTVPSMIPYPATVPNTLPLMNFKQLLPPHQHQFQQEPQLLQQQHFPNHHQHQYPTPPPHVQLQQPVILPQTPRSSSVKDGVLGLLRPINERKFQSYQDMVDKQYMSIPE